MKKRYAAQAVAIDWALVTGLSFSLFWSVSGVLQYRISLWGVLLQLCLFALAWVLVMRVRVVTFIFLGLLAAAAVAALLLFRDEERLNAFVLEWRAFGTWIWEAVQSYISDPPGYLGRAVTLACAGASLLMGFAVCCRLHPVVILLAGGGLFFAQEFLGFAFSLPSFFLFLLFFSLYIVQFTHRGQAKRSGQPPRPLYQLRYALPLCALALTLVLLAPAPEHNLGQGVIDRAGDLFSDWNLFSGYDAGFGNMDIFSYNSGLGSGVNTGELGGRVRQTDDIVLTLQSDRPPSYLKGHTYDVYTGRQWMSSDNVTAEYATVFLGDEFFQSLPSPGGDTDFFMRRTLVGNMSFLYGAYAMRVVQEGYAEAGLPVPWPETQDTLEALFPSFLGLSTSSSVTDSTVHIRTTSLPSLLLGRGVVTRTRQTIVYQDMRTRTLFVPQDALNISSYRDSLYVTANGDLVISDRAAKGYRYSAEGYKVHLSQAQRGDLLRAGGQDLLDRLREETDTLASENPVLPSYASDILTFLNAGARDAERYLSLPDTLPERVRSLAEEITREEPTDYDKALALERHLRVSYRYDLNTPATPKGRDFVDYFLFDLKRGYCTYYASAMTVMARAIGLPARYVEGFLPGNEKIEGRYYATGKQAHAWTEIYFPGFGWVIFEPTASVRRPAELSGESPAPELPPEEAAPAQTPAPTQTPAPALPEPGDGEGARPVWPFILAGVLLVCAVPVWLVLRRRAFDKRARHGPPDRSVCFGLYRRIVRLAEFLGAAPPAPGETPLEFGRRADIALGTGDALEKTAEVYGRVLFGPGEPSEEDQRALWDSFRSFDERAGKRGRLRRWLWKFFRGG